MDELKKNAAKRACSFIKNQKILGLGTGSTVEIFIKYLSEKKHLFKCVASSKRTYLYAKKKGFTLIDIDNVDKVDILIDGADFIDKKRNMIKGKGGAHLKEKILAYISKEYIIICDESKMVNTFFKKNLPIEIIPYGFRHIKKLLEKKGYFGKIRLKDKKPFITDSKNYILDVFVLKDSIKKQEKDIKTITGVVETGFFIDLNPKVIIAYKDDKVKAW